jgi:DNA-binding transcriptional ArsR family regulator
MLQQTPDIDRLFHALADATRRELIQQLSQGPAGVSELARPLPMSLAAVLQHIQVLEECGVVTTRKVGRVRTCELDPRGLRVAERWIARRRTLWEGRLDRLGALLEASTPSPSAETPEPDGPRPQRRRGVPPTPIERE